MSTDIADRRRSNLDKVAQKIGGRAVLAKKCGKSIQQISGMLTGAKSFGERIARNIEASLGIPPGTLDAECPDIQIEKKWDSSKPEATRITALEVRKEYALISPPKTSKIRLMELDGEWLYEQPIDTSTPDELKLLSMPGDNMEPEILKGASVVVDLRQREFNMNGIFAVAYSGSIFVHRVQVQPGGKFVLWSDNKKYEPIRLDNLDGIFIIGRCILVNNPHGI